MEKEKTETVQRVESEIKNAVQETLEQLFKAKKMPSLEEQANKLKAFLQTKTDFQVGDFVKLNAFGESIYKLPKKNSFGLITNVFDKPVLHKNSDYVHGMLACVGSDGEVRYFPASFQAFEKVDAEAMITEEKDVAGHSVDVFIVDDAPAETATATEEQPAATVESDPNPVPETAAA